MIFNQQQRPEAIAISEQGKNAIIAEMQEAIKLLDKLRQRHEEQQDKQQNDRMDHTRYRRTSAIIYIRHRPRDSTGSRNTAEQRRYHIRDTKRNQLSIRVMMIADHTVRHRRRE